MGFFDSKSSQSGAEGTVGAQTESGSPSSVNIAAGKNLKSAVVNISNEFVDPGALTLARDLGAGSLEVLSELTDATQRLGSDTLASAERLGDVSLKVSQDFGRDAFDLGRSSLELTDDVSARVFTLARDNQDFVSDIFNDALDSQTGLVDRVIDTVADSGKRFLADASALISRESTNADGRIEAITNRTLLIGGGVLALAVGVAGIALVRR